METKRVSDSLYFRGFDDNKYRVVSISNIQSNLQIDDAKDKYKGRCVGYRYNALDGIAELLITK
jgi:hypothetical protein